MPVNFRRRTRFALFTFAALLSLAAIWFSVQMYFQQRAVRALRASGGTVTVKALRPDWLPDWIVPTFLNDFFVHRTFEVQFANVAATDVDLAPLADLGELTWIELHTTHVEGPGLAALRKHTEIKRLFLNSNPITDEGLVHLRDLDKIDWLELSGTRITDTGLQHLSGMRRLNRLSLSATNITDVGLPHLLPLQGLQHLRLYKTGITDAAVDILSQMRGLKELELVETQLSDTAVAELQKALPDCQIMHRLPADARRSTPSIDLQELLDRNRTAP